MRPLPRAGGRLSSRPGTPGPYGRDARSRSSGRADRLGQGLDEGRPSRRRPGRADRARTPSSCGQLGVFDVQLDQGLHVLGDEGDRGDQHAPAVRARLFDGVSAWTGPAISAARPGSGSRLVQSVQLGQLRPRRRRWPPPAPDRDRPSVDELLRQAVGGEQQPRTGWSPAFSRLRGSAAAWASIQPVGLGIAADVRDPARARDRPRSRPSATSRSWWSRTADRAAAARSRRARTPPPPAPSRRRSGFQ